MPLTASMTASTIFWMMEITRLRIVPSPMVKMPKIEATISAILDASAFLWASSEASLTLSPQ